MPFFVSSGGSLAYFWGCGECSKSAPKVCARLHPSRLRFKASKEAFWTLLGASFSLSHGRHSRTNFHFVAVEVLLEVFASNDGV